MTKKVNDDLFPNTPWNRIIAVMNHRLLEHPDGSIEQSEILTDAYYTLRKLASAFPSEYNMGFVLQWYESWCNVSGRYIHGFEMLYPSVIITERIREKLNVIREEIDNEYYKLFNNKN